MTSVRLTTRLGEVEGLVGEGVQAYLGLRYAHPPVGARRFMPAQPSGGWAGTHDATQRRYRAMQPDPDPRTRLYYWPNHADQPTEDCLFLNVFTPAADSQSRPVMVWIHGGSLERGSANDFDGSHLAVQGDVVIVAVNYRLGYFGFLDLSRFGDHYAGSASNGFGDQITALGWIRDNISDYGGDPTNVTIFGESSGGASVTALLSAPTAAGLFHRAAALSPISPVAPPVDVIPGICAALRVEEACLLDALLALTPQHLLTLQGQLGVLPTGVIDGVILTHPTPEALRRRGQSGVPVLTGYTRDEGQTFAAIYEDLGMPELARLDSPETRAFARLLLDGADPSHYFQGLRQEYPDRAERDLSVLVFTDVFRRGSCELAEAASEAGPGGWLYRFDLSSPLRDGAFGACHAVDLPFIFNDFEGLPYPLAAQDVTDPTIRELAQSWSNMLIAFARTGRPAIAGLLDWPRYAPADRHRLNFGPETHVVTDSAQDDLHRALWHSHRQGDT